MVTGLTEQEGKRASEIFTELLGGRRDRVKQIMDGIRSHPVIAWLIVIGTIVTGMALFTESVNRLITNVGKWFGGS